MVYTSRTPLRVLAFERYDPTEKSIDWLRQQGLEVQLGHALWEMPFQRFTEDQLIVGARGCVALMGVNTHYRSRDAGVARAALHIQIRHWS